MGVADQPEPFGPYLLLRPLGRGGMGVVYVARSRRSDHPIVALKRLRADTARVPSFRERFEHECALALRLRHPRLVQALDAGDVAGVPYVASELIHGLDVGAIAENLRNRGRGAPIKFAVRIMVDLLAGLDYVHEAREPTGRPLQLVHRDLTPGNVLVGYDGFSRLADFGLAKSLLTEDLQLTATGTILGTPKFLAPEVAQGATADPRADLYGLGAVIYRLLVGSGPYDGEPREVLEAVLTGPPKPLTTLRPDLPKWFVELLDKLMAREPERRASSAREIGTELLQLARQHDALLSRPRAGQFLRDLFSDEYARQSADLRRDRAVDVSLVPTADKGTRVLRAPKAPLEAPKTPDPDDEFDLDALTLQPFDPNGHPRPPSPDATAATWRPDPAALTELADRAVDRPPIVLEPTREEPKSPAPATVAPATVSLEGPTRRWDEAAPAASSPAVQPAPPRTPTITQRLGVLGGRTWTSLFFVAVMAAVIGGAIGFMLSQTGSGDFDDRRFALTERLGAARQTAAQLRARGVALPNQLDDRLDAVKAMLIARDDLTRAQLELQEVELLLGQLR